MNLDRFPEISRWPALLLSLDDGDELAFPYESGGCVIQDGLELAWSLASADRMFRLSCQITNRRATPVRLKRARVFASTSQDDFTDAPFSSWRVERLGRNKNDIPGRFSPSVDDLRLREAILDTSEVPAGNGLRGVAILDDPTTEAGTSFYADPAIILLETGATGAVLLGFDGQERHLNSICLTTSPDRQRLLSLTAAAELDGAVLAPGGSRRLQDFIVEQAESSESLLDRHAERVRSRLGSRKAPFRSIYCTWYYYGRQITRDDVLRNLDFIRREKLPFDAVQIDSGWFRTYGDWETDTDKFPGGMQEIAEAIRAASMQPGIWTAPFVLSPDCQALKQHPDLMLRKQDGTPCRFVCDGGSCLVLDPYAPSAPAYLNEFYGHLRAWGFTYHKLDFLRAVFIQPEARFHQADCTRGEAYRHAMALVRKAVGEDAVINACGGLYEGSCGLCDILRSSADLVGHWDPIDSKVETYPTRMKQNLFRRFYNRLWTNDPDALQLRRNRDLTSNKLSLGLFTDDEAFSICVNQLIGGGLMTVSENFPTFDADRLALLRLLMPFVPAQCTVLDACDAHYLPERLILRFPEPWHGSTLAFALLNWNCRESRQLSFRLDEAPEFANARGPFVLQNLLTEDFRTVESPDETLTAEVPGHGAVLFNLTSTN